MSLFKEVPQVFATSKCNEVYLYLRNEEHLCYKWKKINLDRRENLCRMYYWIASIRKQIAMEINGSACGISFIQSHYA
jgi:hypothetical protein